MHADDHFGHVLLTGAGGFVGAHVLEHILVNTDWDVTATDSFRHHGYTDRIREVLERHPEWRERVEVVTHDLIAPWSNVLVARITARFGTVTHIFNVASESHVDRSIAEPSDFIRNNCELMLSMLELARAIRPVMFLHLSTDEVYGAVPLGRPSLEWDPILPSSPYSASKAAQEAFAIAYWRTFDIPLVLVNCMNIIGERQDPEKFIPKTIAHALTGEPMPIHTWGDKPGARHYLHARNLADAMLFIARVVRPVSHVSPLVPGGVVHFPDRFNVVGEAEVGNLEMAERIAGFVGKPLNVELVPADRPGYDAEYALDGAKLAALGWTPPVPLWKSIERLVAWSIAHPQWLALQKAPAVSAV